MGTKHNKKRYLVVKYKAKPDKKFDELVIQINSKKKINSIDIVKNLVVLNDNSNFFERIEKVINKIY